MIDDSEGALEALEVAAGNGLRAVSGGATWTVEYDFAYSRRLAGAEGD